MSFEELSTSISHLGAPSFGISHGIEAKLIDTMQAIFSTCLDIRDTTPIARRLTEREWHVLDERPNGLTTKRILELSELAKTLTLDEFHQVAMDPFGDSSKKIVSDLIDAPYEGLSPLVRCDVVIALLLAEPPGGYDLKFTRVSAHENSPENPSENLREQRLEQREALYTQLIQSASIAHRLNHIVENVELNYWNLDNTQIYDLITSVGFNALKNNEEKNSLQTLGATTDPYHLSANFSQTQRRALRVAALSMVRDMEILKPLRARLVESSDPDSTAVLFKNSSFEDLFGFSLNSKLPFPGTFYPTGAVILISERDFQNLADSLGISEVSRIQTSLHSLCALKHWKITVMPDIEWSDEAERDSLITSLNVEAILSRFYNSHTILHGVRKLRDEIPSCQSNAEGNQLIRPTLKDMMRSAISVGLNDVHRKFVHSIYSEGLPTDPLEIATASSTALDQAIHHSPDLIGIHIPDHLKPKAGLLIDEEILTASSRYCWALQRCNHELQKIYFGKGKDRSDIDNVSRREMLVGRINEEPHRFSELVALVPVTKWYRLLNFAGINVSEEVASLGSARKKSCIEIFTFLDQLEEAYNKQSMELLTISTQTVKILNQLFPLEPLPRIAQHLAQYPGSVMSPWGLKFISGSLIANGSKLREPLLVFVESSLTRYLQLIEGGDPNLAEFARNVLLQVSQHKDNFSSTEQGYPEGEQ